MSFKNIIAFSLKNLAYNFYRWLCGNIALDGVAMETAIVRFYEPVYGTMYFRQPKSTAHEDTTVLIELAAMVRHQEQIM